MKYKTEKLDIGTERGQIGPRFATFEEAKEWCHKECKEEGRYINLCYIYSIRDAEKDWHAPDLYTCIWNRKEGKVDDVTDKWNDRLADVRQS